MQIKMWKHSASIKHCGVKTIPLHGILRFYLAIQIYQYHYCGIIMIIEEVVVIEGK